jgi:tRNA pseudouridine32 synthase/23S rRNA pseudouridine746 synthase
VDKTYWAVAPWRADLEQAVTHRSWLQADQAFFRSVAVSLKDNEGRYNSETHLQMIKRDGDLALYELKPVTGQRHQLRVHMQSLGAPIVGDQFYPTVRQAAGQDDDLANPLQLLARQIRFIDPINQQVREFKSELTLQFAQTPAAVL